MSDRDALRELQARLASRMHAVRTEPPVRSWLALECAGQGLLIALHQAGEIFTLGKVAAVPHTKEWFAGVANLRGRLHGVIDLARFLGLRSTAAAGDGARLVTLNPALGVNCALLVERLAGLRSADQLHELPAQAAGARPAFAAAQWREADARTVDARTIDSRTWQEIDLAALAAHEQFLGVAA